MTASGTLSWYHTYHRAWERQEYKRLFVSSPNANWCPWIRPLGCGVYLRADGTFGMDDPICWPQYHHPDTPHIPCIPICDPDPQSPIYLFRRGLHKEHTIFTGSREGGLRIATISDDLGCSLKTAVSQMAERARTFLSTNNQSHPRLENLMQSLGIAANRLLTSQAPVPELRVAFGITSRFCFESQGYINYHSKYLPRLESTDIPTVDTNVVGVWARDAAVCANYHRMGVPVWFVRDASLVSNTSAHRDKIMKPREYPDRPRYPEDCFRDDRIVTGHAPLFHERPADTGALVKEIDSWVGKKLEEGHQ